jgi:hypothetical protein
MNFHHSFSTYELGIDSSQQSTYGCFQLTGEVEVETLYDVVYYPDSGQVIQMVSRSLVPSHVRNLRRLLLSTREIVIDVVDAATPNFIYRPTRTGSTAPGRAYNQIYRHMTAAGLITHATLSYEALPTEKTIKRDIAQFTKRLRKEYPVLPYVAVPERGEQFGGFHWHCALPTFVEDSLIQKCWIRGDAFVTRMQDYDALLVLIKYLGKTFFQETDERDFYHRYKKDKKTKIRKMRFEGLNQADVEMFLQLHTGSNSSTLTTKNQPNDWVVAIHNWKPEHLNQIL